MYVCCVYIHAYICTIVESSLIGHKFSSSQVLSHFNPRSVETLLDPMWKVKFGTNKMK